MTPERLGSAQSRSHIFLKTHSGVHVQRTIIYWLHLIVYRRTWCGETVAPDGDHVFTDAPERVCADCRRAWWTHHETENERAHRLALEGAET